MPLVRLRSQLEKSVLSASLMTVLPLALLSGCARPASKASEPEQQEPPAPTFQIEHNLKECPTLSKQTYWLRGHDRSAIIKHFRFSNDEKSALLQEGGNSSVINGSVQWDAENNGYVGGCSKSSIKIIRIKNRKAVSETLYKLGEDEKILVSQEFLGSTATPADEDVETWRPARNLLSRRSTMCFATDLETFSKCTETGHKENTSFALQECRDAELLDAEIQWHIDEEVPGKQSIVVESVFICTQE